MQFSLFASKIKVLVKAYGESFGTWYMVHLKAFVRTSQYDTSQDIRESENPRAIARNRHRS